MEIVHSAENKKPPLKPKPSLAPKPSLNKGKFADSITCKPVANVKPMQHGKTPLTLLPETITTKDATLENSAADSQHLTVDRTVTQTKDKTDTTSNYVITLKEPLVRTHSRESSPSGSRSSSPLASGLRTPPHRPKSPSQRYSPNLDCAEKVKMKISVPPPRPKLPPVSSPDTSDSPSAENNDSQNPENTDISVSAKIKAKSKISETHNIAGVNLLAVVSGGLDKSTDRSSDEAWSDNEKNTISNQKTVINSNSNVTNELNNVSENSLAVSHRSKQNPTLSSHLSTGVNDPQVTQRKKHLKVHHVGANLLAMLTQEDKHVRTNDNNDTNSQENSKLETQKVDIPESGTYPSQKSKSTVPPRPSRPPSAVVVNDQKATTKTSLKLKPKSVEQNVSTKPNANYCTELSRPPPLPTRGPPSIIKTKGIHDSDSSPVLPPRNIPPKRPDKSPVGTLTLLETKEGQSPFPPPVQNEFFSLVSNDENSASVKKVSVKVKPSVPPPPQPLKSKSGSKHLPKSKKSESRELTEKEKCTPASSIVVPSEPPQLPARGTSFVNVSVKQKSDEDAPRRPVPPRPPPATPKLNSKDNDGSLSLPRPVPRIRRSLSNKSSQSRSSLYLDEPVRLSSDVSTFDIPIDASEPPPMPVPRKRSIGSVNDESLVLVKNNDVNNGVHIPAGGNCDSVIKSKDKIVYADLILQVKTSATSQHIKEDDKHDSPPVFVAPPPPPIEDLIDDDGSGGLQHFIGSKVTGAILEESDEDETTSVQPPEEIESTVFENNDADVALFRCDTNSGVSEDKSSNSGRSDTDTAYIDEVAYHDADSRCTLKIVEKDYDDAKSVVLIQSDTCSEDETKDKPIENDQTTLRNKLTINTKVKINDYDSMGYLEPVSGQKPVHSPTKDYSYALDKRFSEINAIPFHSSDHEYEPFDTFSSLGGNVDASSYEVVGGADLSFISESDSVTDMNAISNDEPPPQPPPRNRHVTSKPISAAEPHILAPVTEDTYGTSGGVHAPLSPVRCDSPDRNVSVGQCDDDEEYIVPGSLKVSTPGQTSSVDHDCYSNVSSQQHTLNQQRIALGSLSDIISDSHSNIDDPNYFDMSGSQFHLANFSQNTSSLISDRSVFASADSTSDGGVTDRTSDDDDEDEETSEEEFAEDETYDQLPTRKRSKVYNIAKEIMTSEQVFVKVLQLLNKEFRESIHSISEEVGRSIVPKVVLDDILKYLPELENFNAELLKDFEGRVENWDENPKIADVFVKKGPFLNLYTTYIQDFSQMLTRLDEACKKYPIFLDAVRGFETSEKCAGLALKHYMLKPIQRLPQYKLLLQDYEKHIPEDSPDVKDTKDALDIVSKIASHANETMKVGDNFQKLLEIQNSLIGQFEVVKPGRSLLKEGILNKFSRKEMQERMFFLFNDVLLYTKPVTNGFKLKNVLALAGMKVSIPELEDFQNEFSIISIQRSFTICAKPDLEFPLVIECSTAEERDEWLEILSKAIDDNALKKKTYEVAKTNPESMVTIDKDFVLGEKAPVWVPDARVTMCMACTSEFTVTWRRHHCRACGRVVCGSCSDYKAPLAYLRDKPVRVCLDCYEKLVTAFKETTPTPDKTSVEKRRKKSKSFKAFRQTIKKRPAVLKEVHASASGSDMSGYLKVLKGKKWKKMWFVLKNNVLYTYKASEDMAAVESMPLLGFKIRTFSEWFENIEPSLVFEISHQGRPATVFRTESPTARERWVNIMKDATVP